MSRNKNAMVLMLAGMIALTGCGYFRLKVDPPRVGKDQTATVSTTLPAGVKDPVKFTFEITAGKECGTVDPGTQDTANGLAQVVFKPNPSVATACPATITAADANGNKQTVHLTVVPAAEAVSIEATTALTIILIAAFATDRIVTALVAVLRAMKRSSSAADAEERAKTVESDKRKERLIYIVLAATLGLLLGYFGNVRILEGLGFSNDVWLNVVLTAVLTTAGSDSVAKLMARMGMGSVGDSESKPLEVKGSLMLERPTVKKDGLAKPAGTPS